MFTTLGKQKFFAFYRIFERELARLAAVQGESLEESEKDKTSFKSRLPFRELAK